MSNRLDEAYESPRCRFCGKRCRVRGGENAGMHRDVVTGLPCDGVDRPLAGLAPCNAACRAVGTMSYPAPYERGKPHASTVVCDSPSHQAEASKWVEGLVGNAGIFTPYAR